MDERSVEDAEVDELLNEFRLTPRHVASAVENVLRGPAIDITALVPDDLRYFDRLVGGWFPGEGLREFYDSMHGPRSTEHIQVAFVQGLKDAFLASSHTYAAQSFRLQDIPEDQLLEFYSWLESGGDRISQVGAIEWGLAKLEAFPKLEPYLERLVRLVLADGDDDVGGRLLTLSGLIVLVDGELARTGICRHRPPYWRRLASIAHASVLERAIVAIGGAPPSEFVDWMLDNRGSLYYFQTVVDMRMEPRWNPDFIAAEQLRAEFVGRIAGAARSGLSVVKSDSFRMLLSGSGERDVPAQVEFPYAFLPGPLEGSVDGLIPMPESIEKNLSEALQGKELAPESFAILVNAALIFRVDAVFAELAADALRRAKYQLRHIKSGDDAFKLLSGLATVAAVTRSHALAEEVRVLMRVVRRKVDFEISKENAMRVSMIAAAAHAELDKWCKYVGECITELSFEEMNRQEGLALLDHLVLLRKLEPQLWLTTARADAATVAFLESFVA